MTQGAQLTEEPPPAATQQRSTSVPTKSIWKRLIKSGGGNKTSQPSTAASDANRTNRTKETKETDETDETKETNETNGTNPSEAPGGGQTDGSLAAPPATETLSIAPATTAPSPTPPESAFHRDCNGVDLHPSASNGNTAVPNPDRPKGNSRRVQREVVAGLPRTLTLARQKSELRQNLFPVFPSLDERRTASVDRRPNPISSAFATPVSVSNPRMSEPTFAFRSISTSVGSRSRLIDGNGTPGPSDDEISVNDTAFDGTTAVSGPYEDRNKDGTYVDDSSHHDHIIHTGRRDYDDNDADSHYDSDVPYADDASMTSSQYDNMIRDELEHIWILNLSMHFRDGSCREKFFVTYRQTPSITRRVTVSIDYRSAPEHSLERELQDLEFQRDKNERIYEAIRVSLGDVQFYDTVTNLKLVTTNNRLHVHVVEDTNEIIAYPSLRTVQHLRCRKIPERDLEFDSHMSGFVYKVRVGGTLLIKKEIPGPDAVDEFLYEVNALNFLSRSDHVITLYGVVLNKKDCVTALLINYAEKGALIDVIYDSIDAGIPIQWGRRFKWTRQIVQGLAEIHEAGFVQGDFTLSNIVIDDDDNARIIDINRRGCPMGWEPPEATPIIESHQRLSMYIGVKSDLYQLGMVLWALAMANDRPDMEKRPLRLSDELHLPHWFRSVVHTCLSDDPRNRVQAAQLDQYFPCPDCMPQDLEPDGDSCDGLSKSDACRHVDSDRSISRMRPQIYTVHSPPTWSDDNPYSDYPMRGRSPPRPRSNSYVRSRSDNCRMSSWTRSEEAPESDMGHSYLDIADHIDHSVPSPSPKASSHTTADQNDTATAQTKVGVDVASEVDGCQNGISLDGPQLTDFPTPVASLSDNEEDKMKTTNSVDAGTESSLAAPKSGENGDPPSESNLLDKIKGIGGAHETADEALLMNGNDVTPERCATIDDDLSTAMMK